VEYLDRKSSSTVVGEYLNLSKLIIESQSGSYTVEFCSFPDSFLDGNYYLVDSNLRNRFKLPPKNVILVEAEEARKTLVTAERLILDLSLAGMTKGDKLVVVGGGYLQDIGTLVASLYMRGVKWDYYPTTLAAMGDSCIGGKSSINVMPVKNLVGNFYPPSKIIIDSSFVNSLPALEIVAGLSEIIKICYARDQVVFMDSLELINNWDLTKSLSSLNDLILLSLESKKYFVEKDEFDTGIRKLLNFGHSFGHAIESASDFAIPHGVAVLIGMIAACEYETSITSKQSELLQRVSLKLLSEIMASVQDTLESFDLTSFGSAIAKDKKNTATELVLVLPAEKGLTLSKTLFSENAIDKAQESTKRAIEMILNEVR
jgi:3-dehydroquinate synthase